MLDDQKNPVGMPVSGMTAPEATQTREETMTPPLPGATDAVYGDNPAMAAMIAKVRRTDLDAISTEEALELAAEVSRTLRRLNRRTLRQDEMDLLARLMSKLLATGR